MVQMRSRTITLLDTDFLLQEPVHAHRTLFRENKLFKREGGRHIDSNGSYV